MPGKKKAKSISMIILVLSILLVSYGFWGTFTAGGNKIFDEMNGFIPFFIMLGGLVLLVVFFILMIILIRRK